MIFDKWGVHRTVEYTDEFLIKMTENGRPVEIRTTGRDKQHVKQRVKRAFPKAKHLKIEEIV